MSSRISPAGPPLEHSPSEFADTFQEFAASGELLPRPEGSPLLEFVSGDLVLYLVDRCGPYLPIGPCKVVLHALIDPHQTDLLSGETVSSPWLEATGRSQMQGVGQIIEQRRQGAVVDAGLPLVLSCPALPPYAANAWQIPAEIGDWLKFATLPPIHGYWISSD